MNKSTWKKYIHNRWLNEGRERHIQLAFTIIRILLSLSPYTFFLISFSFIISQYYIFSLIVLKTFQLQHLDDLRTAITVHQAEVSIHMTGVVAKIVTYTIHLNGLDLHASIWWWGNLMWVWNYQSVHFLLKAPRWEQVIRGFSRGKCGILVKVTRDFNIQTALHQFEATAISNTNNY